MLALRKRQVHPRGKVPNIGDMVKVMGTVGVVEDVADGYIMWKECETGERYLSRPGSYEVFVTEVVPFASISVGEFFRRDGETTYIKSSPAFGMAIECGDTDLITIKRVTDRDERFEPDQWCIVFDTFYVEEGE